MTILNQPLAVPQPASTVPMPPVPPMQQSAPPSNNAALAGAAGVGAAAATAGGLVLKKPIARLAHGARKALRIKQSLPKIRSMSTTQLNTHESGLVNDLMGSLSPETMATLKNSKLVKSGVPVEQAVQIAQLSLKPGEDLATFIAKQAHFISDGSYAFFNEMHQILKEAGGLIQPPTPQVKNIANSQRVGTPDDPKGLQVRPLNNNSVKQRGVATAEPIGFGDVAKVAFADSGFGPTGGVWRPRYSSVVQPLSSPAMGSLDPHLKEGGDSRKRSCKKGK